MLPCQSANVHTHSVLLCKEKGKMNNKKKSLEAFRKKRKHRNTGNPTYLYIMHIGAGQGRRGIDITNLGIWKVLWWFSYYTSTALLGR